MAWLMGLSSLHMASLQLMWVFDLVLYYFTFEYMTYFHMVQGYSPVYHYPRPHSPPRRAVVVGYHNSSS